MFKKKWFIALWFLSQIVCDCGNAGPLDWLLCRSSNDVVPEFDNLQRDANDIFQDVRCEPREINLKKVESELIKKPKNLLTFQEKAQLQLISELGHPDPCYNSAVFNKFLNEFYVFLSSMRSSGFNIAINSAKLFLYVSTHCIEANGREEKKETIDLAKSTTIPDRPFPVTLSIHSDKSISILNIISKNPIGSGSYKNVYSSFGLVCNPPKFVPKALAIPKANTHNGDTAAQELATELDAQKMLHKYGKFKKIPPEEQPFNSLRLVSPDDPTKGLESNLYNGDLFSFYQKRGSRLTLKENMNIFTEIFNALDYTHNAGLVHGDVKPENFLYTTKNGTLNKLVLSDYGLSFKNSTRDKINSGTRIYFAPEMASPNQITQPNKVDVYAAGLMGCAAIFDPIYSRHDLCKSAYAWCIEKNTRTHQCVMERSKKIHDIVLEQADTACKTGEIDCFEKIIADSLIPDPADRLSAEDLHTRLKNLPLPLPAQAAQSPIR